MCSQLPLGLHGLVGGGGCGREQLFFSFLDLFTDILASLKVQEAVHEEQN